MIVFQNKDSIDYFGNPIVRQSIERLDSDQARCFDLDANKKVNVISRRHTAFSFMRTINCKTYQ